MVENSEVADLLVTQARRSFANTPLQFQVVSARLGGGEIS